MAGNNEGIGLFRRMARKVGAPARDLVTATRPAEVDSRPTEYDKAEMKAMIERKRRNDYVRKRELDMLRRIRREGLSGEQAAALTMQSSRLDEVEARAAQSSDQGSGIKAKIDAIERQMVGANSGVSAGGGARPSSTGGATRPSRLPPSLPPGPPPPVLTTTLFGEDEALPTLPVPLRPPGAKSAQASPATPPAAPDPFRIPAAAAYAPELSNPVSLPPLVFEHFDVPPPDLPLADAPDLADLAFTESPSSTQTTQTTPSMRSTSAVPPPAPLPAAQPTASIPTRPGALEIPTRSGALQTTIDLGHGERVEVSEATHDEGLDEAVIAFAGGDFPGCERSLQLLVGPRGERREHDETWLAMFDLYRAIGQQAKFESLAMEYAEHFHRSAPQWFSLPRLLAEATAAPGETGRRNEGAGWVCPPRIDGDAVNRLEALSIQMPLPWVMDWSALAAIDVEAAGRLQKLFTAWASQAITMRWIGGERLFGVLQEVAPTGVRDVDPVYWMLRLEALRLAHRPDQFDEVAIDYCVTFEVSPPSWENARCKALLSDGEAHDTRTLSMSVIGEAVTTFMDMGLGEDDEAAPAPARVTSIELAGQLSGDIGELLSGLTQQAGSSRVIRISCALLMRVDFVAAGDLLNWVAARHAEGREIVFQETHRLVALMFSAMGINESARVQLRHG